MKTVSRIATLVVAMIVQGCAPMMQDLIAREGQTRPGVTSVGGGYNPQGRPFQASSGTRVRPASEILASRGVHLAEGIPKVPRLSARVEKGAFATANGVIAVGCVIDEMLWRTGQNDCTGSAYKRLYPEVVTIPKKPILIR